MTRNPFHSTPSLKIAYECNSTHLATHETQEHVAYDEVLINKALDFIEIDLDDGVKVDCERFESLVGKVR